MTGRPVTSSEEAIAAVKELVARGCSAVILTRGPSGCLLMSSDHQEPVHVPTQPVDVVDATVSPGQITWQNFSHAQGNDLFVYDPETWQKMLRIRGSGLFRA